MRKLTQIAAVALVAGSLLPALALAKNDNNNGEHGLGIMMNRSVVAQMNSMFKIKGQDNDSDNDGNHGPAMRQAVSGNVTATSTTGFSLTDNKGTVWTINTSSTTIVSAFGQSLALANITVGSHANVQGTVSGNTVTANRVVISPANTHPAAGKGTVTAVNGNSFTLQLNTHGIVSSATVNTNASTTVVAQNGSATTTAAITVGSKVGVKGLWDQVLNVLNAIKIRLF